MGLGEGILFALTFAGTISASFLIAVPLAGALVRFRANYTPKGLQLDGEGGVQPYAGPVVSSYFGMLMRAKRLEGWSGLYKGFMPSFVSTMVLTAFILMLPGAPLRNPNTKYTAPVEGIWHRLFYSLFLMVTSLPVTIITNRSITTPYRLPWFNARYSLKLLLTSTERRKPWTILFTPGLLASEVLRISYVILIMDPIRQWIFPKSTVVDGDISALYTLPRISIYLVLVIISTAVNCPLEVVSTRLSIQRNHATGTRDAADIEEEASMGDVVYSASDEDVIGLRPDDDPYTGFVDCVKRIINEEGYKVLFRAWWLVLIPLLAVAFA